jgi:hypothetical protein
MYVRIKLHAFIISAMCCIHCLFNPDIKKYISTVLSAVSLINSPGGPSCFHQE